MLVSSEPRGHFVQFAGADDRFLVRNVGRFLYEGLKAGEGLVTVATPERSIAFIAEIMRLGGDPESAIAEGRFMVRDRDKTLDAICMADQPNADRFDAVVGGALRGLRGRKIRAYGEMVGKLWSEGRRAQASCLEDLWNELQRKTAFTLFCSYTVDIFGAEFDPSSVDAVLCAHTQLLPSGLDRALDRAVNSAMEEVLGDRVDSLREMIQANYRPAWGVMPKAESVILWLRNNLPDLADAIIQRARARYHALTQDPSWEPA
jgi:hypothetical protein